MKRSLAALFAGLFLVSGLAWAQSTMTDSQVLDYVQQGLAQGKSQKELVAELSLRGVTKAQAERVYKAYQERQGKAEAKNAVLEKGRQHSVNAGTSQDWAADTTQVFYRPEEEEMEVFGRNIFRSRDMTFAPSENMATPRNYKLGPGDEVIIDVFGHNQTTLREVISPEGSINVEVLGPVYLSGKTVEEANAYLKKRLASIYGGLGKSGTDMRLSLGQIRSIQINVMGDVAAPGTYVLSGFATAFFVTSRWCAATRRWAA